MNLKTNNPNAGSRPLPSPSERYAFCDQRLTRIVEKLPIPAAKSPPHNNISWGKAPAARFSKAKIKKLSIVILVPLCRQVYCFTYHTRITLGFIFFLACLLHYATSERYLATTKNFILSSRVEYYVHLLTYQVPHLCAPVHTAGKPNVWIIFISQIFIHAFTMRKQQQYTLELLNRGWTEKKNENGAAKTSERKNISRRSLWNENFSKTHYLHYASIKHISKLQTCYWDVQKI